MLAYGDDTFEISLEGFVSGFERRLSSSTGTLEEARLQLILAGQLQQAAEDADLRCLRACRQLTEAAADAFVHALDGGAANARIVAQALSPLRRPAQADADVQLRLRTPEGFAWYSLYPDAYVQAARSWLQSGPTSRVLVIGIRSIGTTLAATVAAALRARGVHADSCTVRPSGHPFQRRCNLPEGACMDVQHAIVVDEGPGLSGSSMASVAEALTAAGVRRQSITFLPGHRNGPGPEGSKTVREWWTSVRQLAVPWTELEVGPQRLTDRLKAAAGELLNAPVKGGLFDAGAGRWRNRDAASHRPILGFAPLFEQPKVLARTSAGSVLLKFSGLSVGGTALGGTLVSGAEHQLARLHELADAGYAPTPLGSIDGWILMPWIKGRRLKAADARRSMLRHMGEYMAQVAGPPLTQRQAEDAFKRLRRMLTNAEHLLGSWASACFERTADSLASEILNVETKSYGDGRLAPHEWIETGDRILKLDSAGHAGDHTAAGAQTLLWDVAGAAVDWELDDDSTCELAALAGVRRVSRPVINFYCAAYAAFRAGLAHVCAAASADALDRDDLLAARSIYSGRLRRELARLDTFQSQRTYIEMSPRP